MKKYLVTYTEDDGGIQTTEQRDFETLETATLFYDDSVKRKVSDLFLCEILKHNTHPLPFSGQDSEMCQKYAALINPELEDWDKEDRFLICDLTGAYIQITEHSYFTQAGGSEIQGTRQQCIDFIRENI